MQYYIIVFLLSYCDIRKRLQDCRKRFEINIILRKVFFVEVSTACSGRCIMYFIKYILMLLAIKHLLRYAKVLNVMLH